MLNLFDELPPWAPLAISLVIAVPTAVVVASMYNKQKLESACHIAAVEWESETQHGAIFKAVDKTYFKKQYVLFREACPNGHALVDERLIPSDVKAAYLPVQK